MFFRHKKTPSGIVLQLIQAFRNEEDSPRQRIVASLGDAAVAEGDRAAVARRVALLLSGQKELIESKLTPEQAMWVDLILRQIERKGVREVTGMAPSAAHPEAEPVLSLDAVEHSHASAAGPELLGLNAWHALKLSQALGAMGFNEAQVRCAQASVINRLVGPVSEHALGAWLENVSSLPDLLGESFHGKHVEGRFYRVGDLLHENTKAIEAHLREQQEQIFGRRSHIFLYDLTNTYFEGVAAGNPEAKHGHSKEKRNDCPLVSLALAYTQDGLPLGHKVFAGNQNDAASFSSAVARLETDWKDLCAKDQRPLFVMDCGIGTAANLLLLRQKGYDYLVSERRSTRADHEAIFASKADFKEIPGKAVFVKMLSTKMPADAPPDAPPDAPVAAASGACVAASVATALAPAIPAMAPPVPSALSPSLPTTSDEVAADEWEETRLFCFSEARGEKEKAMLTKARSRFEADLHKLALSIKKGKLTASDKVSRRIGRLCERHSSVSRYYKITTDLTTETRAELATAAQSKSAAESPTTTASQTAHNPGEGTGTAGDAESGGKRKATTTKMKRVPNTATAATGTSPRLVSALTWAAKPGPDRDALCGSYCLRSNRSFPEATDMWTLYPEIRSGSPRSSAICCSSARPFTRSMHYSVHFGIHERPSDPASCAISSAPTSDFGFTRA